MGEDPDARVARLEAEIRALHILVGAALGEDGDGTTPRVRAVTVEVGGQSLTVVLGPAVDDEEAAERVVVKTLAAWGGGGGIELGDVVYRRGELGDGVWAVAWRAGPTLYLILDDGLSRSDATAATKLALRAEKQQRHRPFGFGVPAALAILAASRPRRRRRRRAQRTAAAVAAGVVGILQLVVGLVVTLLLFSHSQPSSPTQGTPLPEQHPTSTARPSAAPSLPPAATSVPTLTAPPERLPATTTATVVIHRTVTVTAAPLPASTMTRTVTATVTEPPKVAASPGSTGVVITITATTTVTVAPPSSLPSCQELLNSHICRY